MSRRVLRFSLLAAAILALVIPVWAHPVRANISVFHPIMVGKQQLAAGTYKVVADSSEVKFEQGSKVVMEVPAHWKQEARKDEYTELVTNDKTGVLEAIHFEGKNEYLTF